MKRIVLFLLLVLSWIGFWGGSHPKPQETEMWVEFLVEEDGTTHKCHRTEYQEMKELLEHSEPKFNPDMFFYDWVYWEKFEKKRNERK